MDMKIEVIKRETIKPSSPTPKHLRKLKLSILDQFGPAYLSPILFFFPRTQYLNSDSSERSRILKQSLSISLIHFYPLAGRINQDNFSIDCNDEGAEFVEARINCPLSKILADPDPRALKKLIPPETVAREELFTSPLLLVLCSFFECGGMTIGACYSHKIADGCTISRHLKCWAAVASSSDPAAALPFAP
ncbi:hypothetical protein TIFTF001_035138 [Ficus carica]|uniref:Uncharacterized protein n=1 Tax=Ficus carica TaxID=3494 RepID=A0AA88E1S6_FICCA|nr:hypothetical protein TIFTF001_035138 [Ficus carica]